MSLRSACGAEKSSRLFGVWLVTCTVAPAASGALGTAVLCGCALAGAASTPRARSCAGTVGALSFVWVALGTAASLCCAMNQAHERTSTATAAPAPHRSGLGVPEVVAMLGAGAGAGAVCTGGTGVMPRESVRALAIASAVLAESMGIGRTADTFEPLNVRRRPSSSAAFAKRSTAAAGARANARPTLLRRSAMPRVSSTRTLAYRRALIRSSAVSNDSAGYTEASFAKTAPNSRRKSSRVVTTTTSAEARIAPGAAGLDSAGAGTALVGRMAFNAELANAHLRRVWIRGLPRCPRSRHGAPHAVGKQARIRIDSRLSAALRQFTLIGPEVAVPTIFQGLLAALRPQAAGGCKIRAVPSYVRASIIDRIRAHFAPAAPCRRLDARPNGIGFGGPCPRWRGTPHDCSVSGRAATATSYGPDAARHIAATRHAQQGGLRGRHQTRSDRPDRRLCHRESAGAISLCIGSRRQPHRTHAKPRRDSRPRYQRW